MFYSLYVNKRIEGKTLDYINSILKTNSEIRN